MKIPRPLPAFFALSAGFVLGAGAGYLGWQSRPDPARPSTPTRSDVAAGHFTPRSAPVATLVLPPPLPPLEASEAIAAWLALGAPTDGSTPAPRARQEAALRALFTRLSDADIPRLLDPLFARTGPDAQNLRQTAIGLWLHRHPAAVAAWVLTADFPPGGDTRYHLARQTGQYWSGRDLAASFAWTETISDPAIATGVLELLLPKFASIDPSRAIAMAEARGDDFWAKLRDPLFEEWAKKDPAAALRRFGREQIEQGSFNHRVMNALGGWFARDLDAALVWLQQEGSLDSNQRSNLLRNSFSRALNDSQNPGALASALFKHPNLPERSTALQGLLGNWQRKDPEAVRAWLAGLPDAATRTDLLEDLIPSTWYEHLGKPQNYLPLALDLPPGELRDKRLGSLVTLWAKTDPAAAYAWLDQQEARDPSLASVVDTLEGGFVAALAARDPVAARARYDALPPGEARRTAAPEIALAWSKSDPAAAARWLAQELPPTDLATGTDMMQYAGYGLNFVTNNSQQRSAQIFGEAVRSWMTTQPAATLTWIESLTDPVQRQLALTSIAGSGSPFGGQSSSQRISLTPQRHAELLATLSQPAERDRTLIPVLHDWLGQDEAAALAWLDTQTALSPAAKEQLLQLNSAGR